MAEKSSFMEHRIGNKSVVLEQDAQLYQQFESQMLKSYLDFLSEKEAAVKKSETKIKKYRELGLTDELANEKEHHKELLRESEDAERTLAAKKLEIQQDVTNKVMIASQNAFKKMSISERKSYVKSVSDKLQWELDSWELKEAEHKKHIKKLQEAAAAASDEEKDRLNKQIADEETAFTKQKDNLEQLKHIADNVSKGFFQKTLDKGINKLNQKTGINLDVEERRKAASDAGTKVASVVDHYKKQAEMQKQILAAQAKGDKARVTELKNLRAEQQRQFEETISREEQKALIGTAALEGFKEAGAETLDAFAKGADNFIDTVASGMSDHDKINANLEAVYGNQAKYIAKLQGSTENWRKSVDNVSDSIGFSGVASKKSVINKMKELVDSGIAYNIELRAFLADTSANIASTFEVTNGTLLRMIRLQQQDSTAARLGMEATLTKLFNKFFEDTSYLHDAADNISSAILDASATMSRDMSLEFEYTMQKWLGSLYSLGMSSEAVQQIATGINYLGTGNVSALNSNAPLQTLLAMSASKAGGKSYADMLSSGLTSEDTNKLLRGMIEYLAEIATSQENMVTRAAYAELFGMSVTDLSAFASLTTSEINSLYKSTVSYQDLVNETSSRLSQISRNMSLTELVNNAIENAEVGVATTIGSNALTYGTWKALGLLQDYVGEIKIPSVLAAGFGLSSDIDLINVAQTGMVGIGMLGSLIGGIESMLNGGPTSLSAWDFNEHTQRGGGLTVLNTGSTNTTSYSATIGVGGATGSVVEDVSMESSKQKAYEEGQTSQEEIDAAKEIPQKIYDALAGESTPTVISLLQGIGENLSILDSINENIAPERVFYSSIVGTSQGTASVSTINTLSSSIISSNMEVETSSGSGNVTNAVNNNSTSTVVSSDTTSSNNSSPELSSSMSFNSNSENGDMQSLIAAAVEQAIRNIVGYSSGSGLPVNVTNLPNGGIV